MLDKTDTKKIKDYIKYLLKVQNETKKAKIDDHNLLVDIFLNKLYTSNQETYFKILNDESFLKSTLNPNLKGGYKTKRRKRSSRNKSMKKKTTAI